MSLSAIPRQLRRAIFVRDDGQCQYCHLRQVGQGAVFHINHVIPKSRGGGTQEDNLVLQCPSCSLHKSDKTVAIDPVSKEEVQLFHPLRQSWAQHFTIRDDGTCDGITPTGRATVAALRMNDAIPRTARAFQVILGLQ